MHWKRFGILLAVFGGLACLVLWASFAVAQQDPLEDAFNNAKAVAQKQVQEQRARADTAEAKAADLEKQIADLKDTGITFYVSNSQGNDANDGQSTDKPVKTLKQGVNLLRDGKGDSLLLR